MFLKKITILFILSLAIILLDSCSESPSDIGSGLLEQDQINVQNEDTSIISSSNYKKAIVLGTSPRLLLGKRGNVEAGILIKFNISMADSLAEQIRNNGIEVESVWIQMVRNYTFGNVSDPLDVDVYNVTSGWTTTGFNTDSAASLQYEMIDQSIAPAATDSITRINLNPQYGLDLLKATLDSVFTNGIYIKPTSGSAKIQGYYSASSDLSVVPLLNMVVKKSDGSSVSDTLIYSTFADLGFVIGELPVSQNLIVQAGLEAVAKINFQLDHIPDNAIINKAELVLTYDDSESMFGDTYINSLVASFVVDSVNGDSLSGSAVLNNQGNTFKGDITLFVQRWVRDKSNSGLVISSSNRLQGVELFSVYGINAETALRPRLKVTYTTKE